MMNLTSIKILKYIFIELIIVLIIAIIRLEDSIDGGYLPLSVIIFGFTSIVALFISLFLIVINRKIGMYTMLIGITGLAAIFLSNKISEYELSLNKKNGNDLVTAIEKYQIVYKKYPQSLNELSPNFINEIPYAYNGFFGRYYFRYYCNNSPDHKHSFDLHFELGDITYHYYSDDETWEKDES